ncbi:unnamed protein product, partial [Prorocentrum cordatum]
MLRWATLAGPARHHITTIIYSMTLSLIRHRDHFLTAASALRSRAGSVSNALLDGPPFLAKLPTVVLLLAALELLGALLTDAHSGVGHAEVLLFLLALAALCASPPRATPPPRGRPAAASCPSPLGDAAGAAP